VDVSSWEARLALPVQPGRDHIRGLVGAPLTLVEYGDYECPFCAAAHPLVNAIRQALRDDLRYVFRHFPLTTLHRYAERAAEAAEAAGLQGEFWAMHDMLHSNHDALEAADLVSYADELGLDTERFVADLSGRVCAAKVREDFISGVRSGVNGTPSFFINGCRHDGALDYNHLLAALGQARR
jgi:protein-disulfide isomerase